MMGRPSNQSLKITRSVHWMRAAISVFGCLYGTGRNELVSASPSLWSKDKAKGVKITRLNIGFIADDTAVLVSYLVMMSQQQ